jgi:hypothetical protein
METREQQYFWMGFDLALAGKLANPDNEMVWDGWCWGAREFCGFNHATKWDGRRERFHDAIFLMRWHLKKMIRRVIRQMKMQCGILINELF